MSDRGVEIMGYSVILDGRVIRNRDDGLGLYTFHLIRNLVRVDPENRYLLIHRASLPPTHRVFALEDPNLSLLPLDVPHLGLSQQFRLPGVLSRLRADIYHYPHLDCPRAGGKRVVTTIHDLKYVLYPDLFPRFRTLKSRMLRHLIQRTLDRSDRVITVSRSTRDDLLKHFRVDPEIVRPIHSGNTLSAGDPSKRGPERKTGDAGPESYFLFVGGTRPHKNLIRALEGFRSFLRAGHTMRFVVVGEEYLPYEKVLARFQTPELTTAVIVRKYVLPDEMETLYRNAFALVFPSLYEGFGFPILEAMTFGTPVITSNGSSMVEVGGDAALYVDPGDGEEIAKAMCALARDEELYRTLSSRGRARSEAFGWETTARATVGVYRELIGRD